MGDCEASAWTSQTCHNALAVGRSTENGGQMVETEVKVPLNVLFLFSDNDTLQFGVMHKRFIFKNSYRY
jgi:predicted enzyme related to lactoylglutathione lyase